MTQFGPLIFLCNSVALRADVRAHSGSCRYEAVSRVQGKQLCISSGRRWNPVLGRFKNKPGRWIAGSSGVHCLRKRSLTVASESARSAEGFRPRTFRVRERFRPRTFPTANVPNRERFRPRAVPIANVADRERFRPRTFPSANVSIRERFMHANVSVRARFRPRMFR